MNFLNSSSSSIFGETATCCAEHHQLNDLCCGGTSAKSFDQKLFSFRSVSAEDYAAQLTLLDIKVFQQIKPEELSLPSNWSGLFKSERAPNVVAFVYRFNQTVFWVQREILRFQKAKTRYEIMSHFIKICKRLWELKNFHSLYAILLALKSQPIYRLRNTWKHLTSHENNQLNRWFDVFDDQKDNFNLLRRHLNQASLPCIPYLGMFQRDITFIDTAHPSTGGLDTQDRKTKLNNILRVISEFQRSIYNIKPNEYIISYLHESKYIEELQRFQQEELNSLSLQLEPEQASSGGSNSAAAITSSPAASSLTRTSIGSAASGSLHLSSSTPIGRHHKRGGSSVSANSLNLIDDTIDQSFNDTSAPSTAATGGGICNSSLSSIGEIQWSSLTVEHSGFLKRRVELKEYKQPPVKIWRAFYVEIRDQYLLLFELNFNLKLSRSRTRSDYKAKPSSIIDLRYYLTGHCHPLPKHADKFYLSSQGFHYKFQCDDLQEAMLWVARLNSAIKRAQQQVAPLIQFVEIDSSNNSGSDNSSESSDLKKQQQQKSAASSMVHSSSFSNQQVS